MAKYSSFWVGLDGYNSSTVEQTGSEADCSGSTPEYYSWYEMYPAYPVNFSNPVSPGDQHQVALRGGQLLRRSHRGGAVLHGQRAGSGRAKDSVSPLSGANSFKVTWLRAN